MVADKALSSLKEPLGELRSQLDSQDVQSALRSIFRVNDKLGRIVRSQSSPADELIDLQVRINAITVEVKRGRMAHARAALRKVDEILEQLSWDVESQKEFIRREGRETN